MRLLHLRHRVLHIAPLLLLAASIPTASAPLRRWMLSREVTPADVLAHFPLQVGNRWIYETKYLTGDSEQPHLDHWLWEVRITRHDQTPDGLFVFRERRELQVLQGEPSDPSGLRADPYLVKDGYVYELSTFVDSDRKDVLRQLHAGELTPDFFFPMHRGLMWAERQREDEEFQEWTKSQKEPDPFYHWQVIAKGGHGHCGCMKLRSSAFDILYFTNGGPSEVAFQDGVGVVGRWERHQGTYWEETTALKQFIPASTSRASIPPQRILD